MPPRKTTGGFAGRPGIGGFVLRLVLFYGLLAAPWPGLQDAYSRLYRAVGNAFFGSFGSNGVVRFLPLETPEGLNDTEIVTRLRGSFVEGASPHSPRIAGYLPTVEVVALILATSLLWGVALTHLFILVRTTIALLYWFRGGRPWALYEPGPFWSYIVSGMHEIVNVSPTASFLVPVFIWVLVAFGPDAWSARVKTPPKPQTAST